jgi:hypothetical protein
MRNDARPIGHQPAEPVTRHEEESVPSGVIPSGVRPQFGGERAAVGVRPRKQRKGRPAARPGPPDQADE